MELWIRGLAFSFAVYRICGFMGAFGCNIATDYDELMYFCMPAREMKSTMCDRHLTASHPRPSHQITTSIKTNPGHHSPILLYNQPTNLLHPHSFGPPDTLISNPSTTSLSSILQFTLTTPCSSLSPSRGIQCVTHPQTLQR